MDKRVIFAVAGSGKTSYIVNSLSREKRSLILTYTNANFDNLCKKIVKKFDGDFPDNIIVMTYFTFLYSFCYKPFLADKYRVRGLYYEQNKNMYIKANDRKYFITDGGYLYSNRLAFFMEKNAIIGDIQERLIKYFDEFIIDEIQDISGRDFDFVEKLMGTDISMLFVGDFYQHTFDTSRDGNVNKSLFNNQSTYEKRFDDAGIKVDHETLKSSWRCSKSVCDYVRTTLGIDITSNRPESDDTVIEYVSDCDRIAAILQKNEIVKLHYQNASKAGAGHRNWGDTKGEDCFHDVCVLLNKTTAKKRTQNKLMELSPTTKNKLYVAITRARGNVYLIDED